MKPTQDPDHADAPTRQPGVEPLMRHLEQRLCKLLGPDTEYCLVISQDTGDVQRVQAITNASAARAHQLLRAVDQVGFDSLN